MEKPAEMTTSSSILEKLRLKRQDNEFIMTPEGFTAGKGKYYEPEDLKIIKTFRFEGDSNPDDSSIIYYLSVRRVGAVRKSAKQCREIEVVEGVCNSY